MMPLLMLMMPAHSHGEAYEDWAMTVGDQVRR